MINPKGKTMKQTTFENMKKVGRVILRKPTVYLPEDFDDSVPAIFMSNHEGFYGPAIITTRFPAKFRPWCHSGVVYHEESHDYIMGTFPNKLPNVDPKVARFIANIIKRPLVNLIQMTNPIPSYHDYQRSIQSIRLGIESLGNNENQLIFSNTPMQINGEYNQDFNFMKGYLLVIRKAMKQGIIPKIYPVSINRKKATISIGSSILPNPNVNWLIEKNRIHNYLVKEVRYGHENPAREYDEILTLVRHFH